MTSGSNTAAEVVQQVTCLTSDLLESLGLENQESLISSSANSLPEIASQRIREYLKGCYQSISTVDGTVITGVKNAISVNFDSSCEWINCAPPSLSAESASKILVFEFFTHCCINCVHSIREVRSVLESLQEDADLRKNGGNAENDAHTTKRFHYKLVSVHSPKFSNEQDPASVSAFVQKMGMDHSAIISDPQRSVWESLGICCWPTILIFGPNPSADPKLNELNLLFALLGEGHGTVLKSLLKASAQFFLEQDFQNFRKAENLSLNERFEDFKISKRDESDGLKTFLKYPGKIEIQNGEILAIADSGNNRILISTPSGILQNVIGSGVDGFADGHFSIAEFSNPQGIAFRNSSVLYVADTGNHAVRSIDLDTSQVTTLVECSASVIAENGNIRLKSPWDVAFYDAETLLIAAAGNHQIFAYFFQDTELFRVRHEAKSLKVIAGTGREENRNNAYILKSAFAQPSGITVGNMQIFIADSESSSIRMIDKSGKVTGLVGGSRDPMDLFAFGDQDGIGIETKLQHPVGVCCSADASTVFVADTFNHKIKVVDVPTKRCKSLTGDIAGNRDGSFSVSEANYNSPERKSRDEDFALLNEPGGMCYDEANHVLYIADTNNHAIRIADMETGTVKSLKLVWDNLKSSESRIASKRSSVNETFEIPFDAENAASPVTVELRMSNLPQNCEGGEWKVILENGKSAITNPIAPGSIALEGGHGIIRIENMSPVIERFSISVTLFFCSQTTCYMRPLHFQCHFVPCQSLPNADSSLVKLSFVSDSKLFEE